ncbi:MAG: hypothetical protein OXF73_00035 [Gammaproteobacteria bacterium]|nr:hypothetical protein [Gammaproteobacteria bacterium]
MPDEFNGKVQLLWVRYGTAQILTEILRLYRLHLRILEGGAGRPSANIRIPMSTGTGMPEWCMAGDKPDLHKALLLRDLGMYSGLLHEPIEGRN